MVLVTATSLYYVSWREPIPSVICHNPLSHAHAAPCHRRAEEVEGYDAAAEQLIETDAQGDGWVSTGQASQQSMADASIPDLDTPDQPGVSGQSADADDDIHDIDDLAIEDEDDEVS